MDKRFRLLSMATLFAAALFVTPAAGSAAPHRVWVPGPPPAPVVEVRPTSPGRGHVWVGGYHRWDGHAHVWVPGSWRRSPRARAAWVQGRWVHSRRGWYWREGHWR